jgi:hypothetical protein
MKLLSLFEPLKISWIESLTFFRPSTLMLFLLVTLKSVKELYSALRHAWSFSTVFGKYRPGRLLLVLLLLSYLIGNWNQEPPPGLGDFLVLFLGALLITLLIKGARPSIAYKNHAYWSDDTVVDLKVGASLFFLAYIPYSYFYNRLIHPMGFLFAALYALLPVQEHKKKSHQSSWKIWAVALVIAASITLIFWIPPYAIIPSFVQNLFVTYISLLRLLFIDEYYLGPLMGPFAYFLSPLVLLVTLFMLDAQKTAKEYAKAGLRAVTMLAYNYPFFLVAYTLCILSVILIHALGLWLLPQSLLWQLVGWGSFILLGLPLYICFITNFYIKRVHEQFSLYYE